ncbi:MAG TPA: 16S rRNA (adenine(1518)-N(6)/adenine(1519)-N(6))-dimethyltransferase RsmA, partial [Candidatus Binatus sp.]|nr:16S rRNA (adenine(1518)-N(6)/adenine(1519)-N(6))-dimethyltransferase RsmA [Candidatus Binatus sp.]
NFISDQNIANRLVTTANLGKGDTVLEPGSGYGTITRIILRTEASNVLAVERDHRLAAYLRQAFQDEPRVSILEGDVLRIEIPEFNKIVGTPAYNISSKLVLLMLRREFSLASTMFQLEFGRRLLAKPGSKDYGRLSVMSSTGLEVESVAKIPRTAFRPTPRVDSILLRIRKKTIRSDLDQGLFEWIVRESFTQRRRLIKGSIRHAIGNRLGDELGDSIVSRMNIPPIRVDQVTPGEFELLTQQMTEALERDSIPSTGLMMEPRRSRGHETDLDR